MPLLRQELETEPEPGADQKRSNSATLFQTRMFIKIQTEESEPPFFVCSLVTPKRRLRLQVYQKF